LAPRNLSMESRYRTNAPLTRVARSGWSAAAANQCARPAFGRAPGFEFSPNSPRGLIIQSAECTPERPCRPRSSTTTDHRSRRRRALRPAPRGWIEWRLRCVRSLLVDGRLKHRALHFEYGCQAVQTSPRTAGSVPSRTATPSSVILRSMRSLLTHWLHSSVCAYVLNRR
jgi:hypothetical protein